MWLLLPVCLLSLTVALLMHDWSPKPVKTCGYASCVDDEADALNVHIVAHTHNDVGWVRTVEEYYSGTRGDKKGKIKHPAVRDILDSVVKELWADSRRRFTYVESYFFFKWWNQQNNTVREKVDTLVQEGRLQFAGGAWSMNDEANTHYQAIIDQFTFGLRHLNDTFGHCGIPNVGWQIDPFGHSREFASLLAAIGFNGVFLGRIDYQDKANRMKMKTMEMLWRGDDSLGESSDLYAGVLYHLYQPPLGFCFDKGCSTKPKIDDKKVTQFVEYVTKMSEAYITNNLMLTMGGDFHYEKADEWFYHLDKLIEMVNLKARPKIKVFYSTPQCYLKAVRDANPTLPTKRDDFFPYAHQAHGYWTGYFTSRPSIKYFEREGNRYLQMAKQLQVLGGMEIDNTPAVYELSSAMGIMQHHDAITGTEKQYVAQDYERILNEAIEGSLVIPREAFNKFMQGDTGDGGFSLSYDRCRLNESSCAVSEGNNQFVVTLYNLLAWNVKEPVRIPVKKGSYEVYAPNGDKIASQLVDIPQHILNIPMRKSKATHEIIFIAHLQPVSYKAFYIKKVPSNDDEINVIQIIKKKVQKRSVETVTDKNVFNKDNHTHMDVKVTPIPLTDKPNKTKDTSEDNNLKTKYTTVAYFTTETNKYTDIITPLSIMDKPNETKNTNDDDYLKNYDATETIKFTDKTITLISLTDKPNESKVTNDDDNSKNNVVTVATDTYTDDTITSRSITVNPNDNKDTDNDEYLKNNGALIATDTVKYTDHTITPLSYTEKQNKTVNTNDNIMKNINTTTATESNKDTDGMITVQSVTNKTNIEDNLKNYDTTVATEMNKTTKKPSLVNLLGKAVSGVKKPLRQPAVADMHMENQHMQIDINPLNQIIDTTLADGTEVKFKVKFYSYDTKYSGAYIFRPNKTTATKIGQKITQTIFGDVVKEIRIDTEENKSSVIRMYDGLNYIENDWVVGPINNTIMGKEIVIRYDTDILSNGDFYTDSNGRQMLKRRLGRPQWNVTITEPVSGNYYPIVNKISIQDKKVKFSVITDRAEGGTSLKDGQLEVMLHRRLVNDDGLGVQEVLNETDGKGNGLVFRGRHRIFLSHSGNGDNVIEEKKNVLQVDSQPLVFVSDASRLGLQEWLKRRNDYSWANELPNGVHLLTLEQWKYNQILLRLENYLDPSDRHNSIIEVDLQSIFKTIELKSFRETTLAANEWMKDFFGSWKTQNRFEGFKIELKAKQIRTFIIDSWSWADTIRTMSPFRSPPLDFVFDTSGVESSLMFAPKSTVLGCLCYQLLIYFFVDV